MKKRQKPKIVGVAAAIIFFISLYKFDACAASYGTWSESNGEWRYYDAQEQSVYGWQWIENGWYYFGEPDDGVMKTGWQKIDGFWYYLGGQDDGAMKTGWQWIDGFWYYFSGSGIMQSGWQWIDNDWYYLSTPDDGSMQKGWRLIAGEWYYFTDDGVMVSGWRLFGKTWFYFGETDDGAMKTGWQKIDGYYYYFYKENDSNGGYHGNMAVATTIDGYEVNSEGVWPDKWEIIRMAQAYESNTDYLILVDTTACKTAVFSRNGDAWGLCQYWDCAPGTKATPTVKGEFATSSKGYKFVSYGTTQFYYTKFNGPYLFHSVPCNEEGRVVDSRLGMKLSHGCVRLSMENAKWIYDVIPYGTKVVVL